MCDDDCVLHVCRVRLAALAAQAHAGGNVTWAQAARAIAPLVDGLELEPWSDPRWIAIPAATLAAVDAAVAQARSKLDRASTPAGNIAGCAVVTGHAGGREIRGRRKRVAT